MSTAAHVTHTERLANARRVVIKIGSALFIDQQTGAMNRGWLEGVCADVADLRRAGKDVVIVSSGAVALGRRELKLSRAACSSRVSKRQQRRARSCSLMPIKRSCAASASRRPKCC